MRSALLMVVVLCAACGSPPSIQRFSADKDRVLRGTPVTLTWNVEGADKLDLKPSPGEVTGSSAQVSPDSTTSYVLTATNSHGSTSSQPVPVQVLQNVITSFAAFPAEVEPGGAVELRWKLALPATSLSVNGAAVAAGESTMQTKVDADTTYTLSATTPLGSSTASVLVRVGTRPKVTSFSADPLTVKRGSATVLRWTASFASTFTVTDGVTTWAVGSLHSLRVRPLHDTTYTLTATNVLGSSTMTIAVTVTGDVSASLLYTDPPVGNEALRLVADPSSNSTQAVLKLVATAALPALSGIALNLPLDGDTAGSRDGSARVSLHTVAGVPDLAVPKLDPATGSPTPAKAIALPDTGPLAGTLALGIAQKPTSFGGPPDAVLAPGDAIATFKLDLVPEGGVGIVFDGTSGLLTPGNGFRVRLRASGGDVTLPVAIGRLETQP
ncbi:MAG: hypothetical protein ACJ79V_10590 [Myxococcales bacterium]